MLGLPYLGPAEKGKKVKGWHPVTFSEEKHSGSNLRGQDLLKYSPDPGIG
jgi:hypothetical protein